MKRKLASVLFCVLIIFMLFSGCTENSPKTAVYQSEYGSTYGDVMRTILPGYEVKAEGEALFPYLEKGFICEAFDVQAVPIVENKNNFYWYPQYLATAGIAIDRDQADEVITGWESLRTAEGKLGFFDGAATERLLLATISYALEGEDYTIQSVLQLLEDINKQGRLCRGVCDTPLLICFDYQAAALKRQGRNIEFIIPEEGTLTFAKGILSQTELVFPEETNEILLSSGLRTLDGEGEKALYPNGSFYEKADRASNFNYMASATERHGRDLRREVFYTRLYSSADQIEHQLFAAVFILLLIIFMGLILPKLLQPEIRHIILLSCGFMAGWVLLRYFKYQMYTAGTITRYCWYGFYVFQLSLPLMMLYLSWILDNPNWRYKGKWLQKSIGMLYGTLLLLVLTNDLHGQVFILDLSNPNWSDEYGYGFLYYIVMAASILPIFAATFLLIWKSRRSSKKIGFLFPVLFSLLVVCYGCMYVMGIPFARKGDFVITVGVFFLLYYGAVILSGLLPVNQKYKKFFARSSLNMQVVNKNGGLLLSSSAAVPLNRESWEKICMSSGSPVLKDANTLLYTDTIPGGIVIWQEDITELKELRIQIEGNIKKIRDLNRMLLKEKETKSRTAAAEEKLRLMTSVEKEIHEKTKRLAELIRSLPQKENKQTEVGKITLLLCYIKRRCGLFFREQETAYLPVNELTVYFNELAEFSEYARVRSLVSCNAGGELATRQATLFYDVFYAALAGCIKSGNTNMLVQILPETGEIAMKLLLPVLPLDSRFFEPSLKHAISKAGGVILVKELDDAIGISLSFQNGGDG